MGVDFTSRESNALYGLLADSATDVILKTDRDGFVLQASSAIERLGFPPAGGLIGHHILDLVHPSWADAVQAKHMAVIAGRQDGSWVEFAARTRGREERWFEIQMQRLVDDQEHIYGTISIMRSIGERRAMEQKLFAASMTDPLTGLTNRPAFVAMLRHLVEKRTPGCLAIFDIDHLKAINMQYGQSVGDEVLVVFADLLRTLMRSKDIISRISGESLAVLLPGTTPDQAEGVCRRIIATLSDIRRSAGAEGLSITASAGVARISGSLDDTIRRAETALFLAKAKGRNRLEMEGAPGVGREFVQ